MDEDERRKGKRRSQRLGMMLHHITGGRMMNRAEREKDRGIMERRVELRKSKWRELDGFEDSRDE